MDVHAFVRPVPAGEEVQMSFKELYKGPHLSASSIGKYIDCGLLYKFSKIDKLQPEFVPDVLLFGSAIHWAIAHINQGRKVGFLLDLPDILGCFEEKWTSSIKKTSNVKYSKGKSFEYLLNEGKRLLSAYFKNGVDDGFKVVSIEEPFSFTIPGLSVPIIGITDCIEEDDSGTIIITDYKTKAKAYSEKEIDSDMQLTLYQLAMKAGEYKDREIMLRFVALIKTKTPKVEQYWAMRSELDEKRLAKKAIQVWEGISKGVFIPNDGHWKCINCSYKTACQNWTETGLAAHG